MPAIIRSARAEDMEELIALCVEHAAYERTDYSPEGKTEALSAMLFAADARLLCLVAEEDGALLGYATFSVEVSTWDADRYMHMDCLFLRPAARNKGIGRKLMQAIAQHALKKGVKRMQWQTPAFNTDAIRFYDRMKPVKKEKVRLFLEEAEVMTLAGE
ncbi:MAG: GNAT family N-acetyltransferase [Flavobacteriales bacterium]